MRVNKVNKIEPVKAINKYSREQDKAKSKLELENKYNYLIIEEDIAFELEATFYVYEAGKKKLAEKHLYMFFENTDIKSNIDNMYKAIYDKCIEESYMLYKIADISFYLQRNSARTIDN